MTYNPFARGPYPVGVRSGETFDGQRGRRLPFEVWYAAEARGLALAHLDAALKGDGAAEVFLAGDLAAVLRERGVDAVAVAEAGR